MGHAPGPLGDPPAAAPGRPRPGRGPRPAVVRPQLADRPPPGRHHRPGVGGPSPLSRPPGRWRASPGRSPSGCCLPAGCGPSPGSSSARCRTSVSSAPSTVPGPNRPFPLPRRSSSSEHRSQPPSAGHAGSRKPAELPPAPNQPNQPKLPALPLTRLPRPPAKDLPTRLVVTEDEPHPSPELVDFAATLEPGSSSPAMPSTCLAWAALGPRAIGNPRSAPDNRGKQMPWLEPVPADRRRSGNRPSGSLKATVRGSSPWRRTLISAAQARRHAGPSSFTGEAGARLGHTRDTATSAAGRSRAS